MSQNAINVCCSTSNLCGYGQGHCDDTTECIDGLICQKCVRGSYLIGTYCCMLPDIPENTVGADKLFLGQGHCTYDWECYGTLICGSSLDTKKDCKDIVPDETSCCKEGMYLILGLYIHTCLTELPRYITQYCISISFRKEDFTMYTPLWGWSKGVSRHWLHLLDI